MSKVNDFGGNGISSMIVEEGLVKKGSGATCGAQYSRIVVEDGAQFDLNGCTYHDYDYTLAGSGPDGTGALISTAALNADVAYAQNTGTSFLRHVALLDEFGKADARQVARVRGRVPVPGTQHQSGGDRRERNVRAERQHRERGRLSVSPEGAAGRCQPLECDARPLTVDDDVRQQGGRFAVVLHRNGGGTGRDDGGC